MFKVLGSYDKITARRLAKATKYLDVEPEQSGILFIRV